MREPTTNPWTGMILGVTLPFAACASTSKAPNDPAADEIAANDKALVDLAAVEPPMMLWTHMENITVIWERATTFDRAWRHMDAYCTRVLPQLPAAIAGRENATQPVDEAAFNVLAERLVTAMMPYVDAINDAGDAFSATLSKCQQGMENGQ